MLQVAAQLYPLLRRLLHLPRLTDSHSLFSDSLIIHSAVLFLCLPLVKRRVSICAAIDLLCRSLYPAAQPLNKATTPVHDLQQIQPYIADQRFFFSSIASKK